jgi:hypothetical protein
MTQRYLTFAFLQPEPDDHWINRATGYFSAHNKCHVELFFESLNQCFSIVWGETARFRPKCLSNPQYEIVSIAVPAKEYNDCLAYCQRVAALGCRFDDYGMWASYVPCCARSVAAGTTEQLQKTFCSKLLVEALHAAQSPEVHDLHPSGATPSRLYSALLDSPRRVCGSVPFKRRDMALHALVMKKT